MGMNTALQFSQLNPSQSPSMKNAWQSKLGAIGKRPGSIPVTTTPLGASAQRLTVYHSGATDKILATSGTSIYKYASSAWTALTGTLTSADIYDVDFTDANSNSRKIIADTGSLKAYDDSIETVAAITPAADDPAPAAANNLTAVNALSPKYVWSYQSHVFVAFAQSDTVWYSKRFYYDYFPTVQYERFVKNNDYVNGCGVTFDNVCLIPMRRSWGVLTGTTFDDFKGNLFLNTQNGVIAPKSIAKITYPSGSQTAVYLSDDGVHEVFDTGLQDTGARQYSTRSLMKDKIDFSALGLTDAEKQAAVGFFYPDWSMYLLAFNQGVNKLIYAYDTRNGEWYPWDTLPIVSMISTGGILYFTGTVGHLKKFDTGLYTDWNESTKATGTAVYFQRYSPLLSFEFSGFDSMWDNYLVEARQFLVPSTLDVSVIFTNDTSTQSIIAAWKNNVAVYGVSSYGTAVYANLQYTDIVNAPDPIYFHDKAKYVQILWGNNRDEPTEIYKDRFSGRLSIKAG